MGRDRPALTTGLGGSSSTPRPRVAPESRAGLPR
jgi:hypothetical protein